MLDTATMKQSILRGKEMATDRWIVNFMENSSDAEFDEVSKKLGINKNSSEAEIRQALENYRNTPEYREVASFVSEAKKIASESAKALPKRVAMTSDGVRRYKLGDADIAVMKSGDTYRIYEYDTGDVSRALSVDELNRAVRDGVKQAEARANAVNTKKTVIDISNNNEIARLIAENKGKNVHEVIKNYLFNTFVGQTFTLSDGRKATMDKRDASKLSGYSSPKGIAQLSALKNLIKTAAFHHSANNVNHPKFSDFHYYEATFKYGDQEYDVWLNIGTAKNDKTNHIYDITNKNEDALNNNVDLRPVGNAIENASSIDSIPQNGEKVNTETKNSEKNSSNSEKKTERKLEAERIDKLLREQVKDYREISDGSQTLVRQVYRQALAHGLSESEALTFARISAHSGVGIMFSKALCRTKDKDGNVVYGDGWYSALRNKIIINPEGTRSANLALIHELDHAIRKAHKGKTTVYMRQVFKHITEDERNAIIKEYEGVKTDSRIDLNNDEFNAYFAEKCLKNKKLQDILFERKGLLEKVVDFFTGASKAYSDDPKLARAAKWYEKRYRKMFEKLSARNKGRNAVDTVVGAKSDEISFALMNKNSLADNVKAVLNMGEAEAKRNKAEGNFVSIMPKTPSVITDNVKDAENLEIIMRFDAFYLATRKNGVLEGHYHDYGEIMAKLPEIIASPEAIVRMDNGRLNLISSVRGTKGNNSILSIELNTVKDINSKYSKYNMVISVIPANDNYTKNNLKNHGIKVEYKKEDLAQVNHQLYEWLAIVNDKSSNAIIPNPDEKVNTSDKKSLEIPSDASLALPLDSETDSGYNNDDDLYTATGAFIREVAPNDRHAFARSLANKTTNMKDGETRMLYIFGNNKVYSFEANGYMHGNMIETLSLSEYKSRYENRKEYKNEINTDRKTADLWIKPIPDIRGESDSDISVYERRGRSATNDSLSQNASGSNRTRDTERVRTNPYTEAEIDEILRKLRKMYGFDDPQTPSDVSFAMPLGQSTPSTVGNVGKTSFKAAEAKVGQRIKASFGTTRDRLYIETVDETYGVEKYLRKVGGREDAIPFVQQVRAAETMAQTMIGTDQYDVTEAAGKGKRLGDGLATIFKPIRTRGKVIEGYDAMFDDYLLHQLNVDRMTLEERSIEEQKQRVERISELDKRLAEIKKKLSANKQEFASMKGKRDVKSKTRRAEIREENKKLVAEHNSLNLERRAVENAINAFVPLENKPVFGENAERKTAITAEESRKIIEEYEKKHPQFREIAEKVWKYSDNLLEMRVKGGLISAEGAAEMRKLYPHYVPSFRDVDGGGRAAPVKGASNMQVSSTVKRAKGGGEDIISIEESLAKQTTQAVKAIQINRLARAVYDAAESTGDTTYVEIIEKRKADETERDRDIDIKPKTNQITFYLDGEIVDMRVAKELFAGFKGLTSPSLPDMFLARAANKVMRLFKNAVTQWSPAFSVRNFVRDVQDAFINSKHPKKFFAGMKGALLSDRIQPVNVKDGD